MKTIYRVILIVIIALAPVLSYSQKKFDGFFKPVTTEVVKSRGISSWMFRPVVSITAMKITLGSETTVQSLNSLGTGLSYSHFTEVNGEPYQNIAVNAMILFGTEVTDVSPLELSLASTVTAWQYLSLGCGWNFTTKQFFLLTGISFSFNH